MQPAVQNKSNDNLTIADLSKICRFCLKSDYYMTNIFTENNRKNLNDPIPNKIERSFQLVVIENDGLPPNICFRCMNRIEIYTDFRDKCIENDKLLRDLAYNNLDSNNDINQIIKKEHSDEIEVIETNSSDNLNFKNNEQDEHIRRQKYMEAVKGETEFYPDENSLLMVVDPTKYYDSSEQSDDGTQTDTEIESSKFLNSQESQKILRDVFLCKYCDLAFTKYETCLIHELSDHDVVRPYLCNFCSFSCNNRNTVIMHIKDIHVTDKAYICVQCKKGFGRRSDLKKHTVVHTGVRPFMCPVCNKNFSRNTNLTKHMRIHTGHKPHVCSKCPRSFITKSDLFRHYQIHLEAKPFSCSTCDATFTRKDKLHFHEKKHVKPEQVFIHSEQPEIKSQSTEEQDTVSMIISLDPFHDIDQIQQEEEVQQNPDQSGFSVPDHIQNLDLVFPEHVTGDIITYQDLENTKNNTERARNFPCDECTKRFTTKTQLQNHKNIHLGIRNHICSVCNKAFLRKRELDRHSVIHTGFKAFACSICHKRFGRKDKLIRHERIHTDEKLFSCNECLATFSRKDGLMLHMKSHLKLMKNALTDDNYIEIKLEKETEIQNTNL